MGTSNKSFTKTKLIIYLLMLALAVSTFLYTSSQLNQLQDLTDLEQLSNLQQVILNVKHIL